MSGGILEFDLPTQVLKWQSYPSRSRAALRIDIALSGSSVMAAWPPYISPPDLAQSLGADRFLREIRTAARLQHPHILSVIDSGQGDGFVCERRVTAGPAPARAAAVTPQQLTN